MQFQRTELLLGKEVMEAIASRKVIVFGVGGVGSWCAESLVRTGFRNLTIVDDDKVIESNINRQLPATIKTVGKSKVEVLKQHFLEINPDIQLTILTRRYHADSSESFALGSYDYVIDAIDSLKDKAHLIQSVCKTNAVLFSSMGAALKMDPSKIKTTEFWKVQGDPLARALRQYFKKDERPARKFQCVYSEERLHNKIPDKANGTLMHITATFGLFLTCLVVEDVIKNT